MLVLLIPSQYSTDAFGFRGKGDAVFRYLWPHVRSTKKESMHRSTLQCRIRAPSVDRRGESQQRFAHPHLGRVRFLVRRLPRVIPQMGSRNVLEHRGGVWVSPRRKRTMQGKLPQSRSCENSYPRTIVAPLATEKSTPGTYSPMPTSDPNTYSFWGRLPVWVCCQMKSSRCKPCLWTPGPMSNVAAADRMASVAISTPLSKLYGWETVPRK